MGVSRSLLRNDGRLQRRVLSTANDTNDFSYAPCGKGALCGACAEIQEDGETSPRAGAFRRQRDEDGVVGERKDNRGDDEQGIAVGGCKRQSADSAVRKTEDTKLRMVVEAACDLAEW